MKGLILALFASLVFVSIPASSSDTPELYPVNGYIIKEQENKNCEVEGQKVSCAYLLALYNHLKGTPLAQRYPSEPVRGVAL